MIYFKTEEEQEEFWKLDTRLRLLLYMIEEYILGLNEGVDGVLVTDALRTKHEDNALGAVGIHPTGRALDFVLVDVDKKRVTKPTLVSKILSVINNHVLYNSGPYKTLIYHDVGHGAHFHLQVNRSGETILRK